MTASTTPTIQDYQAYTTEDQEVWRILFTRQREALEKTASRTYLRCLDRLSSVLNESAIPHFPELSQALRDSHGWSIAVVPGFLPVDEFFGLLAKRRFCSSTWIRNRDQLDYLEEPDMFHDIFGHIPLFLNADYARFAERLAKLALTQLDDQDHLDQLQRLYWFTIEFGLIREGGQKRIYGAGICSSIGETRHVFSDSVMVKPFVLDEVLAQTFVIDEVQNLYFAINSFDQLIASVETLARRWNVTL